MALRSIPVMRALADVKPVQQAMPGSSVVFSIYSDLAQATSTLTETTDVSSIALGNPSQVTVTLNEYGSAVTTTKKLNLTSFNDVDSALADIIAYNAADSLDNVVGQTLVDGTNVIYGGSATSSATVVAASKMTVSDIREAVTELRTGKALPRMGELYAAYVHPRQAADLRAESGTGGFQELTKYVDRTPFVAGAVGVIEGAYIVETPRVLNGSSVGASGNVQTTNTITNLAIASGTVTVTTASAHGLGVGQVVTFSGTVAPFTAVTGAQTILTVGSDTTFTVLIGSSTVSTAATSGTVTFTNNYRAVIAGREALAEAQASDISTVIGPEIDALRRFRTIGWYYFGGFSLLRQAALYRIETSATNG
jgi:N4-gp56 family major capsid protein